LQRTFAICKEPLKFAKTFANCNGPLQIAKGSTRSLQFAKERRGSFENSIAFCNLQRVVGFCKESLQIAKRPTRSLHFAKSLCKLQRLTPVLCNLQRNTGDLWKFANPLRNLQRVFANCKERVGPFAISKGSLQFAKNRLASLQFAKSHRILQRSFANCKETNPFFAICKGAPGIFGKLQILFAICKGSLQIAKTLWESQRLFAICKGSLQAWKGSLQNTKIPSCSLQFANEQEGHCTVAQGGRLAPGIIGNLMCILQL